MKANYLYYYLFELRQAIEKKGFVLPWRLILGERQLLTGAKGTWSYTAFLENMSDAKNLILRCSYGFMNSQKQHSFTQEIPKELVRIG